MVVVDVVVGRGVVVGAGVGGGPVGILHSWLHRLNTHEVWRW